jgi:hypothetical protein
MIFSNDTIIKIGGAETRIDTAAMGGSCSIGISQIARDAGIVEVKNCTN